MIPVDHIIDLIQNGINAVNKCKAVGKRADELIDKIHVFKSILAMIPNNMVSEHSSEKDLAENEKDFPTNIYPLQATEMSLLSYFNPIQVCYQDQISTVDQNVQSVIKLNPNNGENAKQTMEAMRELLKIGVKIIQTAVIDIRVLHQTQASYNPLQFYSYYSIVSRLDEHFEAIDKFTLLLQQAVSVASYSISFEQLENTLNVTKTFKFEEFRTFWKNKIGVGNNKLSIIEFSELLVDKLRDTLSKLRDADIVLKEEFVGQRYEPKSFLLRALAYHFNKNNDRDVTIAEIEAGVDQWLCGDIAVDVENNFWDIFAKRAIEIETAFRKEIRIKLFNPALDKACQDAMGFYSTDRVVKINPLEMVRFQVQLPLIDAKTRDSQNYVTLMRMETCHDTDELLSSADETVRLQELPYSHLFLTKSQNAENGCGYNLFSAREKHVIESISEHSHKRKYYHFLHHMKSKSKDKFELTAAPVKIEGTKNVPLKKKHWKPKVSLRSVGCQSTMTVSYSPTFLHPGLYTLRYVLAEDDGSTKSTSSPTAQNYSPRQQLVQQNKSYYFANTLTNTLTTSKIIASTLFMDELTKDACMYSFFSIPLFTMEHFIGKRFLYEQYEIFLHSMYAFILKMTSLRKDFTFHDLLHIHNIEDARVLEEIQAARESSKKLKWITHDDDAWQTALFHEEKETDRRKRLKSVGNDAEERQLWKQQVEKILHCAWIALKDPKTVKMKLQAAKIVKLEKVSVNLDSKGAPKRLLEVDSEIKNISEEMMKAYENFVELCDEDRSQATLLINRAALYVYFVDFFQRVVEYMKALLTKKWLSQPSFLLYKNKSSPPPVKKLTTNVDDAHEYLSKSKRNSYYYDEIKSLFGTYQYLIAILKMFLFDKQLEHYFGADFHYKALLKGCDIFLDKKEIYHLYIKECEEEEHIFHSLYDYSAKMVKSFFPFSVPADNHSFKSENSPQDENKPAQNPAIENNIRLKISLRRLQNILEHLDFRLFNDSNDENFPPEPIYPTTTVIDADFDSSSSDSENDDNETKLDFDMLSESKRQVALKSSLKLSDYLLFLWKIILHLYGRALLTLPMNELISSPVYIFNIRLIDETTNFINANISTELLTVLEKRFVLEEVSINKELSLIIGRLRELYIEKSTEAMQKDRLLHPSHESTIPVILETLADVEHWLKFQVFTTYAVPLLCCNRNNCTIMNDVEENIKGENDKVEIDKSTVLEFVESSKRAILGNETQPDIESLMEEFVWNKLKSVKVSEGLKNNKNAEIALKKAVIGVNSFDSLHDSTNPLCDSFESSLCSNLLKQFQLPMIPKFDTVVEVKDVFSLSWATPYENNTNFSEQFVNLPYYSLSEKQHSPQFHDIDVNTKQLPVFRTDIGGSSTDSNNIIASNNILQFVPHEQATQMRVNEKELFASPLYLMIYRPTPDLKSENTMHLKVTFSSAKQKHSDCVERCCYFLTLFNWGNSKMMKNTTQNEEDSSAIGVKRQTENVPYMNCGVIALQFQMPEGGTSDLYNTVTLELICANGLVSSSSIMLIITDDGKSTTVDEKKDENYDEISIYSTQDINDPKLYQFVYSNYYNMQLFFTKERNPTTLPEIYAVNTLPKELNDPSLHNHVVYLEGSVYDGAYMCDMCKNDGENTVYHCDLCQFDAHLHCALMCLSFKMYQNVVSSPSILETKLKPIEYNHPFAFLHKHFDNDHTFTLQKENSTTDKTLTVDDSFRFNPTTKYNKSNPLNLCFQCQCPVYELYYQCDYCDECYLHPQCCKIATNRPTFFPSGVLAGECYTRNRLLSTAEYATLFKITEGSVEENKLEDLRKAALTAWANCVDCDTNTKQTTKLRLSKELRQEILTQDAKRRQSVNSSSSPPPHQQSGSITLKKQYSFTSNTIVTTTQSTQKSNDEHVNTILEDLLNGLNITEEDPILTAKVDLIETIQSYRKKEALLEGFSRRRQRHRLWLTKEIFVDWHVRRSIINAKHSR